MRSVKKIVLGVIVLLFFSGTVVLESFSGAQIKAIGKADVFFTPSGAGVTLMRSAGETVVSEKEVLEVNDVITTPETQSGVIVLPEGGIIRISPGSMLSFRRLLDVENGGYVFELAKGRLWLNTLYAGAGVNIVAGTSVLIPGRVVMDVTNDGAKMQFEAIENHVLVGLIKSSVDIKKYLTRPSKELINSFLVAQGGQASVHFSKVSSNVEDVSRLLYSKLIKEFQYTIYDQETVNNDPWILKNVRDDRVYTATLSKEVLKHVTDGGLKVAELNSLGYEFTKFGRTVSNAATIFGEKVLDRNMNAVIEQLDDAEYLLLFGRVSEANSRLSLFKQLSKEYSVSDAIFHKALMQTLADRYDRLAFVTAGDILFEAKQAISDALIELVDNDDRGIHQKFMLVRDYLNSAYSLAASNASDARDSLDNYLNRISTLLRNNRNFLIDNGDMVLHEVQIYDNLLKQFPQFYQKVYFENELSLQDFWLSLLPEGGAKQEERQTVISSEIDFLKSLQNFYLDEQISQTSAKQIVSLLLTKMLDQQSGAVSGVAQLFALRLKNYDQFLRFLSTVDAGVAPGVTVKDRYNRFLEEVSSQVTLGQVIDEFLGNKVEDKDLAVSIEKISAQITADFEAAKVTDLVLGEIEVENQKTVRVDAVTVDGIAFSCSYEWEKKLVTDLKKGDGVIVTHGPLKVDGIARLMRSTIAVKPTQQSEVDTQQTEQDNATVSKAQKVAKILLIRKLKLAGVTVGEANIRITDLDSGLFGVEGAKMASDAASTTTTFDFEYNNKMATVSGLEITVKDEIKPISGQIPLDKLAALVKAVVTPSK